MAAKTNAVRIFEAHKLTYNTYEYSASESTKGTDVAKLIGINQDRVFKTLVTAGKSGEHYVFIIPVAKALELKKAAAAVAEKAVEMIKQKELLPLTGYVHGGCSPVGMKKPLRTVIHTSAASFDKIVFSAGKIGMQIETPITELAKVIKFELADIAF